MSNLRNILASAGCMIVNSFFDTNMALYPDTALYKNHATEVLTSLNFRFRDPKTGTGLFCSNLIVTTLSSYYGQIQGVVDVRDIHHLMYFCNEGPIGAIALSLASVSPFTISKLV